MSLLLTAGISSLARSQTIDTRTGENKAFATLVFGQTFTAPAGATSLDRFQFFVTSNAEPGESNDFAAYLMRWGGTAPTGPVLFSTTRQGPPCCTVLGESFETGGIAVTAGDMFVAFLAPLGGAGLTHMQTVVGGVDVGTYAGGAAVFAFSCGASSPLDCSWAASGGGTRDNEFVADFSSTTTVPEPSSVLLIAGGLAALFGWSRVRHGRHTRTLWM